MVFFMYNTLIFSGGLYRFDELVEFVEDVGGMVLGAQHFHISRGSFFLSEEICVMLILPENEFKSLESVVKDIKGRLTDLKLKDDQKHLLRSYLPVYNVLSRIEVWVSKENFVSILECPCSVSICSQLGDMTCIDELEKILDDMCTMDMVEHRVYNGRKEYRLKNR
jgi:hypothetical protein